jgi:hypothetical protein
MMHFIQNIGELKRIRLGINVNLLESSFVAHWGCCSVPYCGRVGTVIYGGVPGVYQTPNIGRLVWYSSRLGRDPAECIGLSPGTSTWGGGRVQRDGDNELTKLRRGAPCGIGKIYQTIYGELSGLGEWSLTGILNLSDLDLFCSRKREVL